MKNQAAVKDSEPLLEGDWRWQLAQRVARSPVLYRATQLREILLYIVRQSILNPGESIHEFDIAYRVLGRRSDFNPLEDNIVRVQMAHLRKKLDLYFSTEGKDEATVLTVALGTYRPLFTPRPMPQAASADGVPVAAEAPSSAMADAPAPPQPPAPELSRPRWWRLHLGNMAAGLLVVALAVLCAVLWNRDRDQQKALEAIHRSLTPWRYDPALNELWAGFFDSNRDTDVVLSDDSFLVIEQLDQRKTPFYGYLGRSYLNPPEGTSEDSERRFFRELVASKTLGNTSEFKLARLFLGLDPLDKRLHLYSAQQYMPALMKQDNLIVIGGNISNPWSEIFDGRLNFTENILFQGVGITAVVNHSPAKGEQQEYVSSDSTGYCDIAYLPHPDHDGKVLLLQGTSSEATEAAGDFLLGGQFSAFRKSLHEATLPYFEILIKTSQVKGTPLTVTVEAYRTYPAQR